MSYLATGLIVIWLTGLLLLAGRWMNFLRILHNNLASEPGYSDYVKKPAWWYKSYFRFSNIDPARLTETGRLYLGSAIWNERILYAWAACGLVLIVSVSKAIWS